MAGGFGTRIRPLTSSLPKPMLPLVNRPIMEHIVSLLKGHDFREAVSLLHFNPEAIKGYFGDGSEFGVRMEYVTPEVDLGTAGAVRAAAQQVDSTFLVISGDLVTDVDLSELIAFHKEKKAAVTIGLVSVPNPLQFGVVVTDHQGRIERFLEKPGWSEVFSDRINTGIYVIEPEVLKHIPPNHPFDFSKDLFPKLLEMGVPLYGHTLEGHWRDVGDPHSYLAAHRDFWQDRVSLVPPGKLVLDSQEARVWAEDGVLPPGVRFEGKVVLGMGAQIGAGVRLKNSVVGQGVVVGSWCEVSGSVVWDRVVLGEGALVSGAVVCSQVEIGPGATVEEECVVAEGSSIGEGALLKAGVKVWPNKRVDAPAVLSHNLIWGERWRDHLFENSSIIGLTNVELTPELVTKIGVAYGSSLPKGSRVLVARDASKASRMLKRAFVGGVLSTGVEVRDLEVCPLPLLRYKLQSFGEEGGVVFCQDPESPLTTRIRFFDKDGLEISAGQEKGIERLFARESFRRVHHGETGYISRLPFLHGFYREGVLKAIDCSLLCNAGLRVVADFCHGTTSSVLPEILAEAGVDVVEINPGTEGRAPMSTREVEEWLPTLSSIVEGAGAQVGFSLPSLGEEMVVVDETGRIYQGEDLVTLIALLLPPPQSQPWCQGDAVLLPVSTPDAVEELLKAKGWRVVRSFHHIGRFVGEFVQTGGSVGLHPEAAPLVGAHQPVPDALFSVLWVLTLMAQSGSSLSQLWERRPAFHLIEGSVSVPLEKKGLLMRRLIEETEDLPRSLEDGVKVFRDGGWVLAIPHQERPEFLLWSYSTTSREEALCHLEEIGEMLRRVAENG